MTITVSIGYGSTLAYSTDSGSTYTTLGEIVDGWDNSVSVNKVDTTLLADKYHTSQPADIDGGTYSFELAMVNTGEKAIRSLADARTTAMWKASYASTGGYAVFTAWVQTVETSVKKREKLTTKITLQVSGDPNLAGSGSGV